MYHLVTLCWTIWHALQLMLPVTLAMSVSASSATFCIEEALHCSEPTHNYWTVSGACYSPQPCLAPVFWNPMFLNLLLQQTPVHFFTAMSLT